MSTKRRSYPPAFPGPQVGNRHRGADLRQWYAKGAMETLAAKEDINWRGEHIEEELDVLALRSFKIADAMIRREEIEEEERLAEVQRRAEEIEENRRKEKADRLAKEEVDNALARLEKDDPDPA